MSDEQESPKGVSISIIGLLSFAMVVGVMLLIIKANKPTCEACDAETTGKLLDVEVKTALKVQVHGLEKEVEHYKVAYAYEVKGKKYSKVEIIKGRPVYGYALRSIYQSKTKAVPVKYVFSNPNESRINLEKWVIKPRINNGQTKRMKR